MEVRFLGAVGVVTGSCTWMRDQSRGWSFLIDCGISFEGERVTHWSDGEWPFDPASIQFVALTHAHMDHCGLLPMLYKKGFKGRVRCTEETAAMAKLVLEGAAQQEGCLYSIGDVAKIIWQPFKSDVALGQPRPVDTDLFLQPYRSGHIIGAVSLAVLWGPRGPRQRSIVFSGDVGPGSEGAEVAPVIRFPWRPNTANYAVLESTYGHLVRSPEQRDPETRLATLKGLVERTVAQQGVLLLPAFALGRVQDLLFDLHTVVASDPALYDKLQIVLDAPMAERLHPTITKALGDSDVTRKAGKVRLRWLGKQVFKLLGLDDADLDDIDAAISVCEQAFRMKRGDTVSPIVRGNELARNWRPLAQSVDELGLGRNVQPQGPMVIVCSSADGGSGNAAQWLPTLLIDSRSIIASTGYTAGDSVMTRVMEVANIDLKERRRHTGYVAWNSGEKIKVRDIAADLVRLTGYSAHADQQELVNWVFHERDGKRVKIAPNVFLQHGEDPQRVLLANALENKAKECGDCITVIRPQRNHDAWICLENDVLPSS